ncbi:MAG TPA: hypothetical protein VGR00_03355, partial [Thermoanaerobaculia bacterium]|nr:hypothetical protein [Thermoanaerobaculia bacterium]
CSRFEPVLLFDNWPHPHGVVPSHLTLAALAYYQPRFTEQAISRTAAEPLFVLDRSRLSAYFEESDRFDNRYYARVPNLKLLARDGVQGLFYVVSSANDLPAPADVHTVLAEGATSSPTGSTASGVSVRALALADFADETGGFGTGQVFYGGSYETDGSFWVKYPFGSGPKPRPEKIAHSTTAGYAFSQASPTPSPSNIGKVAVLVTASGLLIGAALDRRGSMNRFSGGWAG